MAQFIAVRGSVEHWTSTTARQHDEVVRDFGHHGLSDFGLMDQVIVWRQPAKNKNGLPEGKPL